MFVVDIDDMHINIHKKLITAVADENLEKVQHYLAQGADVNYVEKVFENTFYSTPALIKAVENGNFVIAKLLIENGANVNCQTNFIKSRINQSPLHYAINSKNENSLRITKLLIDNGADVNAKNDLDETPLHLAIKNSFDKTKILIDNGANINIRNEKGKTALDIAKESDMIGKTKIISLLKPKVKAKQKHKQKDLFSMGR